MGETRTDVKLAARRVALQGSTVHIGHLEVSLKEAAEYMRGIPAEKWELAFVHAVQVGMAEIIARRKRFETGRHTAPPAAAAPRREGASHAPETPIAHTVEPVSRRENLVAECETPVAQRETAVAARAPSVAKEVAKEDVIQPRISPPLEPKMEMVAEHSGEKRSNVVRPQLEPDGWLRRLDEDFEILDQA